MKRTALIILCFSLLSCASLPPSDLAITPIQLISDLQSLNNSHTTPFIGFPQPNNYSICHGHTCKKFAFISLSTQQWQSVTDLFSPIAIDAPQEREQIKQAIALLEVLTGEQAGTDKDRAENDIQQSLHGQTDCIDEATNSTVYLRMLSNADLLIFHQQASRTSRGGLITPHNTATIVENESNTRYAVDSWFYANGEPPMIVPLEQWESGWKPEK